MSAMRDQEAELYAQNEEANKRFQAAEAEILAQQTAAESEISKCKANMLCGSLPARPPAFCSSAEDQTSHLALMIPQNMPTNITICCIASV